MRIGKTGRIGPICWRLWRRGMWCRLFGVGFTVEHSSVHRPSFSERVGATRRLSVFGYQVKFLGSKP
jgi:hypothetical protein